MKKKETMKIGDLAKHKRFPFTCLITELDDSALVGIYYDGAVRYISKYWLEVINESK